MDKKSKKAKSTLKQTVVIFIIAVVVVVYLLIRFLTYSPGEPLGSTCIPPSAQSEFLCEAPAYYHGTVGTYPAGNVVLTVGQNTGTNWIAANIFFVPQGTPLNTQKVPSSITTTGVVPGFGTAEANVIMGGLISGQTATVSLGVPGPSTVPLGATISPAGTVWTQYWNFTGGPYYTQIGVMINLRAI